MIDPIQMDASLTSPVAKASEQSTTDFRNVLVEGLRDVNTQLVEADATLRSFAAGGDISTHELMLSIEKAKFSMELAVEVRNKITEAYQEFMRMQI